MSPHLWAFSFSEHAVSKLNREKLQLHLLLPSSLSSPACLFLLLQMDFVVAKEVYNLLQKGGLESEKDATFA